MKILTEYPVRVVKEQKLYTRKNFDPAYASADADDDFYGIDGKNVNQVKAFQDWLDSKGIKWVKATNSARNNGSFLNKGDGYGNYKSSTKNAYKVYGSQWESSVVGGSAPISTTTSNTTNISTSPSSNTQSSTPPSATAVPPTTSNIEKMKKKGFNWDKAKGVWTKAQGFWGKAEETGILGKVGDYFGLNLGNKPQTDGGASIDTTEPIAETPAEEKGMSKGMKIGLAVGGAVILIAVIYMATRPKGTTPKVATA